MNLRDARAAVRLLERRSMPAPEIEGRVIAELVLYPARLEQAQNLEVDDFVDFRNQTVFGAIRTLHASGQPSDLVTIEALLARRDERNETYLVEHAGMPYMGLLFCKHPTYAEAFGPAQDDVFAADLRQLRIVRETRAGA